MFGASSPNTLKELKEKLAYSKEVKTFSLRF